MTSTVFVNTVTLTDDDWFNDLNRLHYTIFGDPATGAAGFGTVISGLTADGTPDTQADYVATYDASAATGKKVLLNKVSGISAAQAFLAGDVALNNTANYFNICNTGSIGASGQTWLIMATATFQDTAGSAAFRFRIWDTSTVFAESVTTSNAAGSDITASIFAVVTPSAAATYHLSAKDPTSTSGVAKTTSLAGTANKATSIVAIRLL